jgi:hypothetical protein
MMPHLAGNRSRRQPLTKMHKRNVAERRITFMKRGDAITRQIEMRSVTSGNDENLRKSVHQISSTPKLHSVTMPRCTAPVNASPNLTRLRASITI